MTTPEPLPFAGPSWLAALELAQARLGRAALLLRREHEPPCDLSEAAGALEAALAAVYDAIDHRDEPLIGLRRSAVEAQRCQQLLEPALDAPLLAACRQALGEAVAHLGEADQRLASRPPPRPPEPAPELMASGQLPRLHALDRPSLAPRIEVAAPPLALDEPAAEAPPPPKSFAELEARVAQLKERAAARRDRKPAARASASPELAVPLLGFAADIPPAKSELGMIRERCRELLEEVAMVGLQRAPLLGDPWRSAAMLELRMLRAIDAIVSMGPMAIGCIEELALDAPVKDGPRLFAAAMVLGCLRGRDALAAAERCFFHYEIADAESRQGFAAALALVPHDALAIALRTLLSSADARHRALAIEVLGYRGLASEAELVSAAGDQAMVAQAALPYLALTRSPMLGDLVAAALRQPDEGLLRAAWLAGVIGNQPRVVDALRESEDDQAPWLLALAAEEQDAARLLERMRAEPTPARVQAVGWAATYAAIAPLLELLDQNNPRLALAAAHALERITGAELREEAEVDAEEIFVADPPEPDLGEPRPMRLAVALSDVRDRPPEPASETIPQPTTDAARWHAWLKEHELPQGRRLRRGRLHAPSVSLWELDTSPSTPAERRALGRELVIRTGAVVRFDPQDFVPVQEQALLEWEPHARRASASPGGWSRPLWR